MWHPLVTWCHEGNKAIITLGYALLHLWIWSYDVQWLPYALIINHSVPDTSIYLIPRWIRKSEEEVILFKVFSKWHLFQYCSFANLMHVLWVVQQFHYELSIRFFDLLKIWDSWDRHKHSPQLIYKPNFSTTYAFFSFLPSSFFFHVRLSIGNYVNPSCGLSS
jgi:hypothetical protein